MASVRVSPLIEQHIALLHAFTFDIEQTVAQRLVAPTDSAVRPKSNVKNADQKPTTADAKRVLHDLRELIAALDRRVPHIERSGGIDIARDAASLREKALARIAELEAESA